MFLFGIQVFHSNISSERFLENIPVVVVVVLILFFNHVGYINFWFLLHNQKRLLDGQCRGKSFPTIRICQCTSYPNHAVEDNHWMDSSLVVVVVLPLVN